MRVNAPLRPTAGPLVFAAVAAWVSVLVVERLMWDAYVTDATDVSGALKALSAAVLCVVLPVVLMRGRTRRWRRRSVCSEEAEPEGTPLKRMCSGMACPKRAVLAPGALAGVLVTASLATGVCALLFWHAWELDVAAVEQAAHEDALSCELVSDPAARDYGDVSAATCHVGQRRVELRILWPDGFEAPGAGHAVRVRGSFSAPEDDEGGRWNHQQGYVGMLAAREAEPDGYASGLQGLVAPFRDACFERISSRGGEGAALLAGVLIGNETLYEGSELEHDFQTTGLAHLMAVSGSHLAVVSALAGWLLTRTPLRRSARFALIALCLVFYVGLTCLAPSAVRSCVMCIVALSAGAARRRQHAPSALALVVLVLAGVSPAIVFSVGFQLSVLAVGGLVFFAPLVQAWLLCLFPRAPRALVQVLAATFAATSVTLPVTVPLFAQLPLVSPLANVLAGPVVTALLCVGIPALLLSAAVPVAGAFLLSTAVAAAQWLAVLVHALADVPGACVPLDASAPLLGGVCTLLLAVLWAVWPVPPASGDEEGEGAMRRWGSRAVFMLVLAAPLAFALVCGLGGVGGAMRGLDPRAQSGPQVVMLDVGQGDSLLVRDGDAAVLVDTGADETLLVRGLARQGVTHLDAVVVTHKDDDHCGALPALAGIVGVEHVYVHEDLVDDPVMAEVAHDAQRVTAGGHLEGMGKGTCVSIGRFSMTCVGPQEGGESGNEDSLVCVLEYDAQGDGAPETRAFLTGDAESSATEGLVDEVGDVDILKVAHHGSRESATEEELAVLKPEIALIGVGADNRYGHPTHEMLDLLSACHAKVYRTDVNGDIALSFSREKVRVSVQKGG